MDFLNSKYGKQIEVLNSTIWENRVQGPKIMEWLNNFDDDNEKNYALYMLSRLMYFSSSSIRNLLKALYRDLYRYPIIEQIRKDNNNTLDPNIIEPSFEKELTATRFLGVGNPSESGVHLLYYFRQENKIPKNLFINTDDIVEYDENGNCKLRDSYKDVKHYVFIDDLCGNGDQATSNTSNVKRCVQHLRNIVEDAKISYFMIFGMSKGIQVIRNSGLYNQANAVVELDESYRCFSEQSRFFDDDKYKRAEAKSIAYKHGYKLMGYPQISLGFGDCQLLLSMHHNTPDNTLPIIWYDEDNTIWKPIFKRYNKVY